MKSGLDAMPIFLLDDLLMQKVWHLKMLHFANIELHFSFFLKGMPVIIISSFTLYIKMKMLKDWTLETKKIPFHGFNTEILLL